MPHPVPNGWPKDRPLAISVNIMCEKWSEGGAPGLGPMGNPLRPGTLDTAHLHWSEYGWTTGIYRLLEVVESVGIKATIGFNGAVVEEAPEAVKRAHEGGHLLRGHAWAQDIFQPYMTREEEDADIKRFVAAFENCVGERPYGFGSPRGTTSEHTAELLVRNGFRWMVDAMNSDVPYQHETPAGPIVIVPWTMDINDLPMTIKYGNQPNIYPNTLKDILDGYHTIGSPNAVLDLGVHAHIFGRPNGAIQFKKALEMVKACDFAWITNREELASLVRPVKQVA